MSGLIGRKIGMTSIFDENGKNIPCTVIEASMLLPKSEPKVLTGEALQLGFDDKTRNIPQKRL
jgi:large subunit ribosomal protein L3